MALDRFVISDSVWSRLSLYLPGKASDRGVTASDNRLFLEAVLWRVRTGSPWRDLPVFFGHWNSVFRRFRRWAEAGIFDRLFDVLKGEADFEYVLIDGTIVSVRQRGTEAQAIGRSKGGLTTKIVAMVDALGNLVRFVLLPGQRNDMVGVQPLIKDMTFSALLADKAFDADWLRAELDERGAIAVIPPRRHRKKQIDFDRVMYRWRHLVENYFAKIKEFRGIATRYDKTDASFKANINLAAAIIAAR